MDDVRAVMDAAGSERAALFGHSEGAPMCMLFAATYPARASHLVLFGAMARTAEDADYPLGPPADAIREAFEIFMAPNWGQGANLDVFAPSLADDPQVKLAWSKLERFAASPSMAEQLTEMFIATDVRSVLTSIRVPTLVLHRRNDLVVNRRSGRWLAERIPGAQWVQLEGRDHMPGRETKTR
jgi:pimeloyl-ACP methyl ester carboxylesterase